MMSNESDVNSVSNTNTIFIQVINRPARKLILKRGINASEYFEYCEEVGCDVWGVLTNIKDLYNKWRVKWQLKRARSEILR